MKMIRAPLAAVAAMLVCSVVSEASFVVTPSNYKDGAASPVNWTWAGAGVNAWEGDYNDGNEKHLPTDLQGLGLQVLFKYTPDEDLYEGLFASSYVATTPAPGNLPEASGLIDYQDGEPVIKSSVKYLLLKDGGLKDYVFDISSWDGTEDLIFTDFWGGNQGKLSHVTILGFESHSGSTVPEPASIAFWGLSLLGGVLVRRRRKA